MERERDDRARRLRDEGWSRGYEEERLGRHVSGSYRGRGPRGYSRTDERIREDVCDALTDDPRIDASDLTVRVENGEVSLEGRLPLRLLKYVAEDIAARCRGVVDVHNRIRVRTGRMAGEEDVVGDALTESRETHAGPGESTPGPISDFYMS